MKAAIYRGIKNIEVVDLPMPTCDDNGIVVKNTYAAICGSDVAAYLHGGDDNMIWRDHEFGHEMATEVVSVGKNAAAQGIKEGDRLYIWGPFAKESMMRAATVGGFSEYMEIMNVGLNKTVFRIPDAIDDKTASIIEPFTIGANAAMCLGIEAGVGRIREVKNGPRVLDLDLLLYDGKECTSAELTLPHPRMFERDFVLIPLKDLYPEMKIYGKYNLQHYYDLLDDDTTVKKLEF